MGEACPRSAPSNKATIAFGEEFLYALKAGSAGGRLRRPSSRRQCHRGHRGTSLTYSPAHSCHFSARRFWLTGYDRGQSTHEEKDMTLERGDRVIFTRNTWGLLWPVRKGTKGIVTRAGWWSWPNIEVTLESGRKLTVSRDAVGKIGRKSWWWWPS